ncbi:MAG: hypothetical protein J6M58_04450 [Clostridium sp.]|nr:hypothetical protein [Clostridium sp.]
MERFLHTKICLGAETLLLRKTPADKEGEKTQLAKELGVSRTTLWRMEKKKKQESKEKTGKR